MNANETLLAVDQFQLVQLELAANARADALRRAELSARALIRRWDKAATLAALRPLRPLRKR